MRRRRIPGPRWLRQWRGRLGWVLLAIVGVPALVDAGLGAWQPVRDGGRTCRIVQVVDGDTLRLWCDGALIERVRLTGFDAPELYSPQCFAETLAAHQAKWALRWQIGLATDLRILREGEDRYGRPLVALSEGNAPVADAMIAAGHGRPYGGGQRDGWCGV
jgi:micrococcal nuclease